MDRKVHCPVCRSPMLVPEDSPPVEKTCPSCGTTFRLPLRRREATDGGGATDGGEDEDSR
jgi:transposase-like protein